MDLYTKDGTSGNLNVLRVDKVELHKLLAITTIQWFILTEYIQ